MVAQTSSSKDKINEIDRLSRCLSMVAHHEEVQQMIDVVRRILAERTEDSEDPEETTTC